ncbi:hypothetical protein BS50DRAFT_269585 [Corynespora cassiicola Philippines]|uniref:Uncharacterized protein n=1 Tax=Corynespora cassiicola Philippines TaxID=1448308 RepID=A0A2T2NZQ1_CORCC|nr:hypothetical protein BS50DRAFT_269585 [Corynespora cassiicola Philippines]
MVDPIPRDSHMCSSSLFFPTKKAPLLLIFSLSLSSSSHKSCNQTQKKHYGLRYATSRFSRKKKLYPPLLPRFPILDPRDPSHRPAAPGEGPTRAVSFSEGGGHDFPVRMSPFHIVMYWAFVAECADLDWV